MKLTTDLAARLRTLGNPERARGAQAYLKSADPFFGVDTPTLRAVLRDFYGRDAPKDAAHCREQIASLWARPEHEMKHAAIEWARHFKAHIDLDALPLYERMIREGAWWDTVDTLAAHLVGRLLLKHRSAVKPVMEAWIRDEHLWIRRAALLAHLTHKEATDEATLFRHCLRLSSEKDFFIRKAIGWALRAYSRTNPEAVRAFLEAHGDRLSGLSFREAAKRLAVSPTAQGREGRAQSRAKRQP